MHMELTDQLDGYDADLERPLSDRLTNADRCDQCQAQALVWVKMPNSENGLLYCAHHFNKHEDKLREIAVEIADERYKLSVKSPPSD